MHLAAPLAPWDHLAKSVTDSLLIFVRPEKRVYLPFLLTALLLAVILWVRTERRKGVPLLRYLFPRRLFLHRSFWFDVRWLVLRVPVDALVLLPLRLSSIAVALSIARFLRHHVGTFDLPSWPRGAIIAAFSVATFVADDLTRYLLHRWMHRIPALWELHKVHHSAEVLSPLTLYRVHPIERLFNSLRGTLTLGAVLAIFMWLAPGRLRTWEILGVDALGFVWSALGANLRHSHVWLTWGRALEHIFISPAQHQLHHARESHATNFGSVLAVWDWLGGSLRVATPRKHPLRIGLPPRERNHGSSVFGALVTPVFAALRVAVAPAWRTVARRRPAPSEHAETH